MYFYFALHIIFDMEGEIDIDGSYAAEEKIKLFPSIPLPLGTHATVNVEPFFLLDFSIEGSATWNLFSQTIEAGMTRSNGTYERFLNRSSSGASKGIQKTLDYSIEGGLGIDANFKLLQFLLIDSSVSGKVGQSLETEAEKECTLIKSYALFNFTVKGSLKGFKSYDLLEPKEIEYPLGEQATCKYPALGDVTSLMMKEQPVTLEYGQQKQLKLYKQYESGETREIDLSKGDVVFRPDQPNLLSISRDGKVTLVREAYPYEELAFEAIYEGVSEVFHVKVKEKKHEGPILPGQTVKLLLEKDRGTYFRVKSLGDKEAMVSYNTSQLGDDRVKGYGLHYKTYPGSQKISLGIDYSFTNVYMLFKNEGSSPIELEYDPSEMNVYTAPAGEMLYREWILRPNGTIIVNNHSLTTSLFGNDIYLYNDTSLQGEIMFRNGPDIKRKKVYPNGKQDRIAMIQGSQAMLRNIGVQPIRVVVNYANLEIEPRYD